MNSNKNTRNGSNEKMNKRRQRMLDEVDHPRPLLRLVVAVLVVVVTVTAAVLGSCQL